MTSIVAYDGSGEEGGGGVTRYAHCKSPRGVHLRVREVTLKRNDGRVETQPELVDVLSKNTKRRHAPILFQSEYHNK